ncbi:MAG TPA: hypothetical protein VFE17_00055 [Candidatus Baltobacteraceae bacterium]|nr:hypothetical protein [Candidatus Baltobacteraceae bacterium]
MRKLLLSILFLAAALPGTAFAAGTVDPGTLPDGTYTATVEKIVDGKHMTVKMQNGVETTVTTNRSNVDFSKAHPNDQIKMSLIKGLVAVYMVTPH